MNSVQHITTVSVFSRLLQPSDHWKDYCWSAQGMEIVHVHVYSPMRTAVISPQSAKNSEISSSVALKGKFLMKIEPPTSASGAAALTGTAAVSVFTFFTGCSSSSSSLSSWKARIYWWHAKICCWHVATTLWKCSRDILKDSLQTRY